MYKGINYLSVDFQKNCSTDCPVRHPPPTPPQEIKFYSS